MKKSQPNEQVELFSQTKPHYQKLSKKSQQQILEQLAYLLLSCIGKQSLTEKEEHPCQEK
ncbi:MAG: hypothetical protein GWN00_19130 [Aliifodinibius sp.]|nr:hypothetical protein [Fodinibius sp.]NIV13175.1 hypothetical protein [Fodinibius sp.]NIY26841.1 hypothetical protein [Fodinibius sp.]